jgi:enoyl reductase-like protein
LKDDAVVLKKKRKEKGGRIESMVLFAGICKMPKAYELMESYGSQHIQTKNMTIYIRT